MTNCERLESMGLVKMLDFIGSKCGACIPYRVTNDYNEVDGQCEAHDWNCEACITDWLQKEAQHE